MLRLAEIPNIDRHQGVERKYRADYRVADAQRREASRCLPGMTPGAAGDRARRRWAGFGGVERDSGGRWRRWCARRLKATGRRRGSINRQFFRLMQAHFWEASPAPVKAVLQMLGRGEDVLRLPMVPVTDATRRRLETLVGELGTAGRRVAGESRHDFVCSELIQQNLTKKRETMSLNGTLQERIEHWFAQGAEAIGNTEAEAAFLELRGCAGGGRRCVRRSRTLRCRSAGG